MLKNEAGGDTFLAKASMDRVSQDILDIELTPHRPAIRTQLPNSRPYSLMRSVKTSTLEPPNLTGYEWGWEFKLCGVGTRRFRNYISYGKVSGTSGMPLFLPCILTWEDLLAQRNSNHFSPLLAWPFNLNSYPVNWAPTRRRGGKFSSQRALFRATAVVPT